jgi:hypothetical protein
MATLKWAAAVAVEVAAVLVGVASRRRLSRCGGVWAAFMCSADAQHCVTCGYCLLSNVNKTFLLSELAVLRRSPSRGTRLDRVW